MPQDQLARWLEELSQYHVVIQHRPGRRHFNADALSCLPMPPGGCGICLEVHPSDLPCGGCPKFKMAHESWNEIAEEVDDVVLLSKPDMGECLNPELSEAVAVDEEPGVRQAEESVTLESRGMFRGGFLGRHGCSMPREVDFEEPGRQEGPFRTQLWLSRHPMYVYVLGSDLEAPEKVHLWTLTWPSFSLC